MNTIAQLWKDFSESDSHLANSKEKEIYKDIFYTSIRKFVHMQNKTREAATNAQEIEKIQRVWWTELVLHWATKTPQAVLEATIAEASRGETHV